MTELQTKVRECFDGKIKALKSIEAISTNIDRISAECTTATTQAVLPVIVRQTLEARLAQVITNPDDREQFIARLVATIPTRTKDITDQKKLREVLERDFYSEVLYEIMKHELEQNLGNFVPDPKRAEPIRTKLLEGLKERVGAAVGLDYKEGGNLHQNTMITELMRDAAILVAADGIELELKNYISNQKQVDDLSQYLITYFKSCMDKSLAPNTQTSKTDDIASTAKRATEAIEHCTLETKTESALNIMETELAKALKENLPGQSSAQKKIRDAILSQNADRLRQQTREALTETGSDTKLTTLKNSLQIQATSLITKTVLEQTLLGMNAAALAPQLEKDLDQCLSGIDQTKKELQPKINMCLNATRRSAVEQILKHQLQPKLSAYFPAESDQSRDILADVQTNLSQCLNAIALEIDPHEFGKKSEACIAPAIFIFTNAIGLAMLEKYSPLLPQDRIPKIEKVFKDCLARSKATPNMAWAQAALVAEQCGDLIKKAIVDGVGVSFVNFSGAELDEDGKKMMKSAFWSLRKILELMEAAPGAVPGATTPPKAPPNSPQDQPTLSEVLQYKAQLESLSALMAQAIKYSPATVRRDLVELGANIRALKKTATRDEITAILLKSSVLRTMIEAQIAAKIEHDVSVDQTTPAPIKKLVSESLSKAHIMRRIFSKGPGADAIDKLIDTIVKPMLDGKTVSMDSVPIEVSESVILALISDTENGGFVEQMLQAIVQEQIDQDIKKSILSWGRWKWIPAKIGRLMYNGNDLDWYSLRDTLAGKEAVAVFATHVLYETMLRPTKKLSDSERAAMRENLVTEANKTLAEAIKISGLANTKWAAATWPKLSQDFAKGMAVVAIDPNLPRLERKRILADRVRRFLNEVDSEIIRSRGQNPPAPDKHGVAEFDKAILQFIDGSLHKSLLEVPLSDNGLEEMKAKLKKLIKTAMKQN